MSTKRAENILSELLKIESNRRCADCGQKGTRWASWNIGVFLCIRCGGLHRKLGTHISRVKSVTLDSWTEEEIRSIQSKGNEQVNAIYNPDPSRYPFPSFSGDMEQYIRDKYERKLFMISSNRSTTNVSSARGPLTSGIAQPRVGFFDSMILQNYAENTAFNSKTDGFEDLVADTAVPLSVSKPSASTNDWTDMELSKSSINDTVLDPLGTFSRTGIQDLVPEPDHLHRLSLASRSDNEVTQNLQQSYTNNGGPESGEEVSGLSKALNATNMFANDDEDPFKELTHNPFQ